MPTRNSRRDVHIGLGGVTRRQVGRPHRSVETVSPSGIVTLTSPPSGVLGIVDPPAFYIPAYQGHPDVGLTDASALTLYSGSSSLNGTYEDLEFSGTFTIANNSTFTNCWFYGGPWYTVLLTSGGHPTFTDCEFGKLGTQCSRLIGLSGGTFTAIRCNFHDAEDGAKLATDSVMRMCHVHDLDSSASSPHYDAIQGEEAADGILIEYCHLSSVTRGGSNGNGAFYFQADFGNIQNVTGRNNYFNGGNYTMYLRNYESYTMSGCVITDNIFGPDYQYGHYSVDSGTVDTWSGNVNHLGNPVLL